MASTLWSSSRLCPGLAASSQRRTSSGLKARSVLSPLQVLTRLNLAAPNVPRPSGQPASLTNNCDESSASGRSTGLVSCNKGGRANIGSVKRMHVKAHSPTAAPVMEVCHNSGDAAGTATAPDCSPAAAGNGRSGPGSPDDCDLGACWGPQKLGQALRRIGEETATKAAARPNYLRATEAHTMRISPASKTTPQTAPMRNRPMRFA